MTGERTPRRRDAGAAAVEMAFVLIILSLLIFGIISFGYLFTFRQNMTQAASEGARAAAVAASSSAATTDARNAADDAIFGSFGRHCGAGGLTCTVSAATSCTNDGSHLCVTVTLVYDYANHPLLPDAPIISQFMPATITVSSTARVS